MTNSTKKTELTLQMSEILWNRPMGVSKLTRCTERAFVDLALVINYLFTGTNHSLTVLPFEQ